MALGVFLPDKNPAPRAGRENAETEAAPVSVSAFAKRLETGLLEVASGPTLDFLASACRASLSENIPQIANVSKRPETKKLPMDLSY